MAEEGCASVGLKGRMMETKWYLQNGLNELIGLRKQEEMVLARDGDNKIE